MNKIVKIGHDNKWSQFCIILLERDLLPNVATGKEFLLRALDMHRKMAKDLPLQGGGIEALREEARQSNTEGGEIAALAAFPTMRAGAANVLSNIALIKSRAPICEHIDKVIASYD